MAGFLSACANRSARALYLSASVPEMDKTRETKILTAFFGLDNGLTFRAREPEMDDFIVTLVNGSDTIKVTPFKLADLGDSENNIDLCLKQAGIPILVEVKENIAIDPNDDKNPKTQVKVLSRW